MALAGQFLLGMALGTRCCVVAGLLQHIRAHSYHRPKDNTYPHIRQHIPLTTHTRTQLSSAIRFVHSRNKPLRCVNAAKVLVTAQHRLYINGSAILDVVGDRKQPLLDLLAEDVRNFGIVLLQTICRSEPSPSLSPYHSQSHSLSLSGNRRTCGRTGSRRVPRRAMCRGIPRRTFLCLFIRIVRRGFLYAHTYVSATGNRQGGSGRAPFACCARRRKDKGGVDE